MTEAESLTREIGERLFSLVQKEIRPIRRSYWYKQKAMIWLMRDQELRVRILRLVDVFPVLKTSQERNEHFIEYLIKGLEKPPLWLKIAKRLAGSSLGAEVLAYLTQKSIKLVANHFIVGSTLEEMARAMRKLKILGADYTIDLLGEATVSEAEAEDYSQKYLSLIKDLKKLNCPVDLSLKLSSLYSQFDPLNSRPSLRVVKKRLRKILREIQQAGGTLTIDMERYYYHDLTLKIFMDIFAEEEFEDFKTPGLAIQTYLVNSAQTLAKLVNWAEKRSQPIKIRLVKGAYWDTEMILAQQKNWPRPVYTQKWQTDASFEKAASFLLAARNVLLAPASHNIRSCARVMAEAEIRKIPKERIEFQVLWGMGEPLMKALAKLGYRVVAYMPCGEIIPGMSYLVRRIIENTSQTSFLFQSLGTGLAKEELLKNPVQGGENDESAFSK